TIAGPWLSGSGFPDKVPAGYWPLPRIDPLDRYLLPLQMQYWQSATSHFDQNGWLDHAWVEVEKDKPGRADAQECVKLSGDADVILRAHPRVRVSLPL